MKLKSLLITFSIGFSIVLANSKNDTLFFTTFEYFIQNCGQVKITDSSFNKNILFYYKSKKHSLYLTKKGISFLFYEPVEYDTIDYLIKTYKWQRVDFTLVGLNQKDLQIIASDSSSFYFNFYNENKKTGISKVRGFKKILYKNIYRNIDFLVYIKDGKIKYDFIIKPGAKINDIRIKYEYADKPTVSNDKLEIKTILGNITEKELIAYQKGKNIKAYWDIGKDGTIKFKISNYNKNDTLIIDPFIIWCSYLGGNGLDAGYSVFANDNYLYISGATFSVNFPVFNPGNTAYFQGTNSGDYDFFIGKFTTSGVPIWITFYGGSGTDNKAKLLVKNNYIYVIGQTNSTDIPLYNSNGNSYFNDTIYCDQYNYVCNKGIIIKFNENGELLWATFLYGREGETELLSIKGNSNSIFTLSLTTSKYFPVYSDGTSYLQTSPNNNNLKYVISKFNIETNELQWSSYICGTNGTDQSWHDIDCNDNLLYIVGATTSTDFPTISSNNPNEYFQPINKGGRDLVIVKFTTNGQMLWSTYFGGTGNEGSRSVCIRNNKLWIGAETSSLSNLYIFNSFPEAYFQMNYGGGGSDGLLIIFDENNQCIYSSYYGGENTDAIRAIITDNYGLWISGITNSNSFPLLNPPTPSFFSSSGNSFLGKFKLTDLSMQWLTKLPVTEIRKLTVNFNYLYITGNTMATMSPILTNPGNGAYFQSTHSGGTHDAFIIQFDKCIIPQSNIICNKTEICRYDSTLIVAQGGISYSWNSGHNTDTIKVSPDSTFTYYVTITDDMQCSISDSLQIIVHQLPNVKILNSHPICLYDSLTLYGSGASIYVWLNSGDTSNNLTIYPTTDSTFILLGIDTNLCSNYDTVKVIVYPLPNIKIVGAHPICFRDSITLYATGGETYFWLPTNDISDSIVVSPETTSTFYVLGIDSNGCKNTDSTTIVVYPLPNVSITGAHPICFGDTITLYANGASLYLWLPTNQTSDSINVAPTSTTFYYLIGTDANGCKNIDTSLIVVFPLPLVSITGDHNICYGDSITLIANGAITYLWLQDSITTNQITVSPQQTTNYIVIGTDIHGCKNSDTTTIVVYPLPNVQILGEHPICLGDSIIITAISANYYIWNTGETYQQISVSPQQSTYYYVTGTDNNGCKNTDSAFVVVYPLPIIEIRGLHNICLYDSITLIGLGANEYIWLPWNINADTITISPTQSTTIILIGTDNNNCSNTDTANITVYPLPTLNISGTQQICKGDSTLIHVYGAENYLWLPDSLTGEYNLLVPPITTNYTIIGSDINGCKDTINFTIKVYEVPVATINGNNEICFGDNVTLIASGGEKYFWNTGDTTNFINISPLNTETYTVVVQKEICYDTASFTIIVNPKPTLSITNDTVLIIGMVIQLNASGAQSYLWDPPTYLSCVNCQNPVSKPSDSITYCVIGKNAYDCSDTACITIIVDKECGELFVPSAFSPNNDGNNDLLFVRGKCIKTMTFELYDRWGTKVFTSNDPTKPWDGKINGKDAVSGVYVYYLKAEYYNGLIINKKGNITLIR